jgi:hypothetical protein
MTYFVTELSVATEIEDEPQKRQSDRSYSSFSAFKSSIGIGAPCVAMFAGRLAASERQFSELPVTTLCRVRKQQIMRLSQASIPDKYGLPSQR